MSPNYKDTIKRFRDKINTRHKQIRIADWLPAGLKKKRKMKSEDDKTVLQYYNIIFFLVKFNLKSGYHHIDISKECQIFIEVFNGKEKHTIVFTKCLRSVV